MKFAGLLLVAGFLLISANLIWVMKSAASKKPREVSVQNEVAQLLARKNNWDASAVQLRSVQINGDYARGEVSLRGQAGGGIWFAARTQGSWRIVHDGNGIIPCSSVSEFPDFPKTMIPKCFDTDTDSIISR